MTIEGFAMQHQQSQSGGRARLGSGDNLLGGGSGRPRVGSGDSGGRPVSAGIHSLLSDALVRIFVAVLFSFYPVAFGDICLFALVATFVQLLAISTQCTGAAGRPQLTRTNTNNSNGSNSRPVSAQRGRRGSDGKEIMRVGFF